MTTTMVEGGERQWNDDNDADHHDGSSSSNNNNYRNRKTRTTIMTILMLPISIIGRFQQYQCQSQRRWRNPRHLLCVVLLLCSFSHLIASSLLDENNIFLSEYFYENNIHHGGSHNGNDFRRAMMVVKTPNAITISSPSFHLSKLMTVPLLPYHELHHRKRRELLKLRLDEAPHSLLHHHRSRQEEEYTRHFESSYRRFTRAYDVNTENADQDRRLSSSSSSSPQHHHYYETGPLYQGYGTHYIDLYVGSPSPRRRTLVVDTGSRSTAFPCSGNNYVEGGCEGCGMIGNTVGEEDDGEYIAANSITFEEKACRRNSKPGNAFSCDFGACVAPTSSVVGRGLLDDETEQSEGKNDNATISSGGNRRFQCRMSASYAEGSTWSAIEASDVVHPFRPTIDDVESDENNIQEFRLKFGCQTKVTGLFQYQLENGILGMDHRDGSFWMQLRDHYKKMNAKVDVSNVADNDAANGNENRDIKSDIFFDPSQFSLCYGRQSLSTSVPTATVGSGALTLGGTDPFLHLTTMVYATNVTPLGGWFAVRIKAIFLRANDEKKYVRVQAIEDDLNGSSDDGKGVIIDSGTTDTYLPLALEQPFQDAWEQALGEAEGGEVIGAKYDNNPRYLTPEEANSLPTILVVIHGHEPSNRHIKSGDVVGLARSHVEMFNQLPTTQDNSSNTLISENDVVVAIPPNHYMEESILHPGRYAARFYFTERTGAQPILGSNFILGHNVHFDNHANRIGFAESHCDYSNYLEKRDANRFR